MSKILFGEPISCLGPESTLLKPGDVGHFGDVSEEAKRAIAEIEANIRGSHNMALKVWFR